MRLRWGGGKRLIDEVGGSARSPWGQFEGGGNRNLGGQKKEEAKKKIREKYAEQHNKISKEPTRRKTLRQTKKQVFKE